MRLSASYATERNIFDSSGNQVIGYSRCLYGNRACRKKIPGQQLPNPVDRMIGNTTQHRSQISLRRTCAQHAASRMHAHSCGSAQMRAPCLLVRSSITTMISAASSAAVRPHLPAVDQRTTSTGPPHLGSGWKLPVWADEVTCVAVGVVLQVILMLRLSLPEGTGRSHLSHHLSGPKT